MILQTGMRTDIPAFYSEWLCNRLREGYVMVRNPYYPEQVTRYEINPDVVDLIAFCTKNPASMMPHLDLLRDYGQYWFVTITPYGKEIEPNVPNKRETLRNFIRLSEQLGKDSIGWRYDPILINDRYTVDVHIRSFEFMAKALSGYTETCIISFIDLYEKVKRNAPEIHSVTQAEQITLVKAFAEIGRRYGIHIKACHEDSGLAQYGAENGGCLNQAVYEKALGCHLIMPTKGAQRDCNCFFGNDIGAYNSCGHFCRYCYANADIQTVRRNISQHNPKSPFLIGESLPTDKLHIAKQESYRDMQLSLF